MEESDVIVKPKPKSEWVSAKTKDELKPIENKFQIWKLNLRNLSKCDLMN
jgi:hypothetical protein